MKLMTECDDLAHLNLAQGFDQRTPAPFRIWVQQGDFDLGFTTSTLNTMAFTYTVQTRGDHTGIVQNQTIARLKQIN